MNTWYRIKRFFQVANIGTLIFFILNIALLLAIFCYDGVTTEKVVKFSIVYVITVIISLSPVGEWCLAALCGARKIKRTDINNRLMPLFYEVYKNAKKETPYLPDDINLKIIYDSSPNACAIGRHTICVTEGLLKLSDNEIMGVLAHEIGHLAYGHTILILLIGGGNLFITGSIFIIKAFCWFLVAFFSMLSEVCSKRHWFFFFSAVFSAIPIFLTWLWTKFCMLFTRWSMRQNEYKADAYACKIGYGNELAYVLDKSLYEEPHNGIFKALYSTHPSSDDRVANMQHTGLISYLSN